MINENADHAGRLAEDRISSRTQRPGRCVLLSGVALAALAVTSPVLADDPLPAEVQARVNAVPKGSYLYLVFSNGAEGREQEFASWSNLHVDSFVKHVPGVVSAQRFAMRPRAGRPDPQFRYLTVYEIKGDPDQALAALGPLTRSGLVTPVDRVLMVQAENSIYEPVTPPFVKPAPADKP